ncbi:MAG: T9SS type A sorting domain-containing protein [Chitinophagaceae bacterium]|nr:MAG: T9SS type A sorting domain-containing protein [Chitinophagaceae bacterium]
MKKFITLVTLLMVLVAAQAQVNGYGKVTSVIGPVLTVGTTNETYDQFNIGDRVIVMQMQDDVIGSNTSNNSSFGNLGTIANAGRYEFATIALVARVAGLVNVITLTGPLNNTYNTGANSSVQIITFPTLGSPNYTTNSNITAVAWNGNIGGVVAFNVNGKLLLGHHIIADGAGFRGGASDASSSTNADCQSTTFFAATNVLNGNKGESIYKVTNTSYAAAMGKIINGGGGGNGHNGGGGGGSNYTAGGDGGMGYNCSTQSGGMGGLALNTNVTGHRFFMGGGGGSGEANNSANTKGGNGGGIVIVKAVELQTVGTGARIISANGQAGNSVGNDGAGGGGAGGTVLTEVFTWTINSGSPLMIQSNGGVGGNVGDGSRHGGGGGGGQGNAVFTSLVPASNVTVSTLNGTGGLNYTNGSRAASGVGTNNGGVITSTFLILPVKLISFTAATQSVATSLQWTTANEQSFGYYEVQLSKDGNMFSTVGRIHGKGEANNRYDYTTPGEAGTSYYRLKMVDADGKFSYSKIIAVRKIGTQEALLSISPNPATSNPVLNIRSLEAGVASIAILNMQGGVMAVESTPVSKGDNPVVLQAVSQLAASVYHVRVTLNSKTSVVRLIVQK